MAKRSSTAISKETKKGKSLQDFRELYDNDYIVPKRIQKALKELGESWEAEMDFSRRANVSLQNLNLYKDQFEDHIIVVTHKKKRLWAGTVKFAEKCREMLI